MDADGGEGQGDRREEPEDEHREPPLCDRSRHGLGERLEAEHRERRVDAADGGAHAAGEHHRIARRAHEQHARRRGPLIQRRIERDGRPLGQPLESFVADHANDRARRPPVADLVADGVVLGKESPRGRLVDDDDHLRGRGICVCEQPPADERHAHRPEIAGSDPPHRDLGLRPRFGFASHDPERVGEAWIERMVRGDGSRVHSWQRPDAIEQRSCEPLDLGQVRETPEVHRIAAAGQLVLGLDDAGGPEARVDLLQPPEALDEEGRTDRERHGQGHLGDDERGSQGGSIAAGRRTVAGFAAKRALNVGPPGLERRNQPEGESCNDRQAQRHREHAQIDCHLGNPRNIGRRERDERPHADDGEGDAANGRRRGEQQTFDGELTEKPQAAGAERRADGDLAATGAATREQQVGHVGARDQQDEPDGRQQDDQAGPHRAEDDGRERLDEHAPRRVLGELPFEVRGNRGQLFLDRVGRSARSPEHEERMRRSRPRLGRLLEGQPDVDSRACPAIRERPRIVGGAQHLKHTEVGASRHDPDDGVGAIVQGDCAADRRGVAVERSRPEAVTENDVGRTPRPRVLGGERAARGRMHADERQEVFRDLENLEPDGLAAVGRVVDLSARDGGEALEALRPLAVVEEVRQRPRLARRAGRAIGLPHDGEARQVVERRPRAGARCRRR